jgi:hypothetical protein
MFIRIFEHWPRQLPSGGQGGVEAKGPSGQCETLASQITCIGEIEQLYPKIKCPATDARRHPLVCQWWMLRDGEKQRSIAIFGNAVQMDRRGCGHSMAKGDC